MIVCITCEHGGNEIPDCYTSYFNHHKDILQTHFAYDLGALDLFNTLGPLAHQTKYSTVSRLLIELNRSLHHPKLFSKYLKTASKSTKDALIQQYYLPYRNDLTQQINQYITDKNRVLHLGIHSFTPKFNGVERTADIGLLFDSKKPKEKAFCKQLQSTIVTLDKSLNVRLNYPYLGKSDGFTTTLRKRFPNYYLGIEIEINQKFSTNNTLQLQLKNLLFDAILSTINQTRLNQ